MKKLITLAISVVAALVLMSAPVMADPSFGPGAGNGNGNNDPQETGAVCHPPGQTDDLPQCK